MTNTKATYIFGPKAGACISIQSGTLLCGLNTKCALPILKPSKKMKMHSTMKLDGTELVIWTWYSNSMMNYGTFSSGDIA